MPPSLPSILLKYTFISFQKIIASKKLRMSCSSITMLWHRQYVKAASVGCTRHHYGILSHDFLCLFRIQTDDLTMPK